MAVYTDVSDEELRAFLTLYELGEVLAFKGIAEGVENSNFLLSTTSGTYVLTLYERRVARDDLPFFLGLMEHLAGRGIACPLPVKARDGGVLHDLRGRPTAVVTFLEGLWPRRIHPFHCQELGVHLARFHKAGAGFAVRRPNALSVDAWRPLYRSCDGRADQVCSGLADSLEQELAFLEAHWPSGLPEGVIHADLFPDNVFFRDEKLTGLIDFYFACNDFFAYDLAICLNAWCFEPDGAFNATKARHLLQTYGRERKVRPEELEALPILARGAALRFLLTRLYDWLNCPAGALVTPKDPLEYWRKLRFHQQVRGPGAYGLT